MLRDRRAIAPTVIRTRHGLCQEVAASVSGHFASQRARHRDLEVERRARLSKSLCGGVEDGDGNAIQRRASDSAGPMGARRKREITRATEKVPDGLTAAQAPLIERTRRELRVRHYSVRTERSYLEWAERFFWLIAAASWRSTTTRE